MALIARRKAPVKRRGLQLTVIILLSIWFCMGKLLFTKSNKPFQEMIYVEENDTSHSKLAKSCLKDANVVIFPMMKFTSVNASVSPLGQIAYLSRSYISGWVCIANDKPKSIFVHIFFETRNVSICFQADQIDVQPTGNSECATPLIARFKVTFPEFFIVLRNVRFELFLQEKDATILRVYFPSVHGKHTTIRKAIDNEIDHDSQALMLLQHRKIIPLSLRPGEPVRINILVPPLTKHLTGGPLSIFHFAVNAIKNGFKVRLLQTQKGGIDSQSLAALLTSYDSLSTFGKDIEFLQSIYEEPGGIPVNSEDMFMATLYSTAYPAESAAKLLRNPNIIYFIQDYEPLFFPQDENWLEAYESYTVSHFAFYSTPLLENYFKFRKESIYAWCQNDQCDEYGWSAQAAISAHKPINSSVIENIGLKRLIAYLRPHSPRNAFDLVIEALSEAVRRGIFNEDEWQFFGVGAMQDAGNQCNLGGRPHFCIHTVHHLSEEKYKDFILTGDIGLSLMVSPHPSLPPFDFAAAGMITVTNSFATKTASVLEKVSKNFIVVDPYLNSMVEGLRLAVERSANRTFRKQNAKLNWAENWDDDRCYGKSLFDKIRKWFKYRHPINQ